nr:glycoside hydrolase family 32 protein [Schaalia suimastitidis]
MDIDLMKAAADAVAASRATDDADYPLFHVAPPVGRLNDPNGLITDGDTYHAFFQYTPNHPQRLVYWGHARSRDLTRWEYLDPAIVPDSRYDRNGAYSGTAFAGEDGYELWYTGNYKDPETGEREATQCLVTSPDLVTFTKDAANPIVERQPDGYTAHFRDPQVWRDTTDNPHHPDGAYRMLLGVQREDETGAALLYRSHDRRTWTVEGEVTFPDTDVFTTFGYMWECPNLLRLRDEVTGDDRDVLIFCPQGIHPNREGFENIFPCIYVVGELRGTQFVGTKGHYEEVDRGFEFYAPQIFARGHGDERGEQPLLMGWAGNAGEDDQPSIATGNWVHCLTVARELSLRDGRLYQRPRLDGLPTTVAVEQGMTTTSCALSALENSRSWRLILELSDTAAWEIVVGRQLRITYDRGVLTVDRSTSRYPHGETRHITLPQGSHQQVEILHDRSITEMYFGGGVLAFTCRSFLDADSTGVTLTAPEPLTLKTVEIARAD